MALSYFQHSRLFFFKTLSSSLSILTAGKPTGGEKELASQAQDEKGAAQHPIKATTAPPSEAPYKWFQQPTELIQ